MATRSIGTKLGTKQDSTHQLSLRQAHGRSLLFVLDVRLLPLLRQPLHLLGLTKASLPGGLGPRQRWPAGSCSRAFRAVRRKIRSLGKTAEQLDGKFRLLHCIWLVGSFEQTLCSPLTIRVCKILLRQQNFTGSYRLWLEERKSWV